MVVVVRLDPQALARQEAMLQRIARGVFQVDVAQILLVDGAGILMRQVDARDALVVGREREWNMRGHICGQRVVACL